MIREYIISRIERAGKDVVMYNKLLSKIKRLIKNEKGKEHKICKHT